MIFSRQKIADLAFAGLMFSIFVSLNSVTYLLLGVKNMASPLILFFCFSIIFSLGIQRGSFDFIGVRLLYFMFLSYYMIGLGSRPIHLESRYYDTIFTLLRQLITSLIIIFSLHQYLFRRLLIERKETKVFNFIFLPVIISSLFSIYQFQTGQLDLRGSIALYNTGRVKGVFANPNTLGFIANLGQVMVFYALYRFRKWYIFKLALIPALFYVSFLSLSRTSIVSSIFLLILIFVWITIHYFSLGNLARRRHIPIVLIPVFILSYIALNFESLLLKYTKFGTTYKVMALVDLFFKGKISNQTTSGRVDVVEYGLARIADHPIFGNGLGAFRWFPKESMLVHGVHNTYLLVLGDSGVFAFFFMIAFILYIILKSAISRQLPGLLAFCLVILWSLHNITGHNGLDDKIFNVIVIFSTMYLWYSRYPQVKEKSDLNK